MAERRDAVWRVALRCCHRLLRLYWFVRRPRTTGAHVLVWHAGRVLLVEQSYRAGRSLPGGGVRRGEDPQRTAARELREEVGLSLEPSRLRASGRLELAHEHRIDTALFFEVELDSEPELAPDRREVVWAGFVELRQALAGPLTPHARARLERVEPATD